MKLFWFRLRVWLILRLMDTESRAWVIQTVGRLVYKHEAPRKMPRTDLLSVLWYRYYVCGKNEDA